MTEGLKRRTAGGMLWSGLESSGVAVVNFVVGVVLARLLCPSDFGVVAALGLFVMIAQTFADSGMQNALIRKTDLSERDLSTAFWFNIVAAVACCMLLYFVAPYVASFYRVEGMQTILRLLSMGVVVNSLGAVPQTLLSISLDFRRLMWVSLAACISAGCIGMGMAYTGYGVWALVAQQLSYNALRTMLLWIVVRWYPSGGVSRDSFKALFSFGYKLGLSALLDTAYSNMYAAVIGSRFDASSLGFYSKSSSLAGYPSKTFSSVIQRVSYPVMSRMQGDDQRLCTNFIKLLRVAAFIVFPLMSGLAALSDPFIRVLLTDKWILAVPMLQTLCLAFMWYPIHSLNLNLLQVKGRSDLFLHLEVIKKCVGVGILCVSLPFGITAICVGQVISSLVSLVINTFYSGRMIGAGFFYQMRRLLPLLINALIMGVICRLTASFFADSLWALLCGGFVGIIYYLCSNILLRSSVQKELLDLIRIMHRGG